MKRKMSLGFLAMASLAGADGQWVLASSTLTYHVSHPLHQSEGVSHAARGKGVCQSGQCNFLIAAPVKSFESGDTNRDLHMLQVTRGAQFPLVSVRVSLPEAALTAAAPADSPQQRTVPAPQPTVRPARLPAPVPRRATGAALQAVPAASRSRLPTPKKTATSMKNLRANAPDPCKYNANSVHFSA